MLRSYFGTIILILSIDFGGKLFYFTHEISEGNNIIKTLSHLIHLFPNYHVGNLKIEIESLDAIF
jgi:hypothetical protein